MERLVLDRITGKRADNKNDYLQIKPEHPDNIQEVLKPKFNPSRKQNRNIKNGKWHY